MSRFDTKPVEEELVLTPRESLSDRELLEAVFEQNAQILAAFVEVQAIAAQGMTQVAPLMEAMQKSPILKMMGVKLGG